MSTEGREPSLEVLKGLTTALKVKSKDILLFKMSYHREQNTPST